MTQGDMLAAVMPKRQRLSTSASDDSTVAHALCAWFRTNARDLPWRRRRTGYTALVSECMLQQTQVSRVIDKYLEFMCKFPNVRSLASASEQQVLAAWQGLGYYRRARNLHAAARLIVRQHRGRMPASVEALQGLPGVGRYTAGAIASIVHGQRVPIVDGNVERVLARLHAKRWRSPGLQRTWAWRAAANLVDRARHPGELNEGLMELGATVCLPSPAAPRCECCPIAAHCASRRLGVQHLVPTPRRTGLRLTEHHHAAFIVRPRSGAVLVDHRGDRGMWAGMWQLPTIERSNRLSSDEVVQAIGVSLCGPLRACGSFRHDTTHRQIHFHVYSGVSIARAGVWRSLQAITDLPMSNAQRKAIKLAARI